MAKIHNPNLGMPQDFTKPPQIEIVDPNYIGPDPIGSEPFCCNPKCRHHKHQVQPTTSGIVIKGQDTKIMRQEVVRIVQGVPITGKFCQVCLEVIKMFNL
jgi:hypothetical protein